MAKKKKSTFQKITQFFVYLMLFVMLAGVIVGAIASFM